MDKEQRQNTLVDISRLRTKEFYTFYLSIKEDIGELLASYAQSNYLVCPAVDITHIAHLCGIKDIVQADENKCGRHGKLDGDIIYLNKSESPTKQRFCIAHEIGHIRLNLFDTTGNKQAAARRGTAWRNNTAEQFLRQFTQQDTKEILQSLRECFYEEIIDYYAANLLIPTERFLLWEDKTDTQIAEAFMVDIKCIAKRRMEILQEIDQINQTQTATSAGISGDVLSVEEISSLLKTF